MQYNTSELHKNIRENVSYWLKRPSYWQKTTRIKMPRVLLTCVNMTSALVENLTARTGKSGLSMRMRFIVVLNPLGSGVFSGSWRSSDMLWHLCFLLAKVLLHCIQDKLCYNNIPARAPLVVFSLAGHVSDERSTVWEI